MKASDLRLLLGIDKRRLTIELRGRTHHVLLQTQARESGAYASTIHPISPLRTPCILRTHLHDCRDNAWAHRVARTIWVQLPFPVKHSVVQNMPIAAVVLPHVPAPAHHINTHRKRQQLSVRPPTQLRSVACSSHGSSSHCSQWSIRSDPTTLYGPLQDGASRITSPDQPT
jgi:hypothetical protein